MFGYMVCFVFGDLLCFGCCTVDRWYEQPTQLWPLCSRRSITMRSRVRSMAAPGALLGSPPELLCKIIGLPQTARKSRLTLLLRRLFLFVVFLRLAVVKKTKRLHFQAFVFVTSWVYRPSDQPGRRQGKAIIPRLNSTSRASSVLENVLGIDSRAIIHTRGERHRAMIRCSQMHSKSTLFVLKIVILMLYS